MTKNNPMFNQSGLPDPTAYHALRPIMKQEASVDKKSHELIKIMKSLAEITGFEVTERIQLKHKKTGKEFK